MHHVDAGTGKGLKLLGPLNPVFIGGYEPPGVGARSETWGLCKSSN